MIWLVEDWAFEEEGEGGLKETRDEELDGPVDEQQRGRKQIAAKRCAALDPMSHAYLKCATSGTCLRDFTRQYFQPNPAIPGFQVSSVASDSDGSENEDDTQHAVRWEVHSLPPKPSKGICCSTCSCWTSDNALVGVPSIND